MAKLESPHQCVAYHKWHARETLESDFTSFFFFYLLQPAKCNEVCWSGVAHDSPWACVKGNQGNPVTILVWFQWLPQLLWCGSRSVCGVGAVPSETCLGIAGLCCDGSSVQTFLESQNEYEDSQWAWAMQWQSRCWLCKLCRHRTTLGPPFMPNGQPYFCTFKRHGNIQHKLYEINHIDHKQSPGCLIPLSPFSSSLKGHLIKSRRWQ